jgi:DNA-binding response OmpR family regulator
MKILIVEDDAGVCGFMKRGLEAERYEVDIAEDGERGLDLAKTAAYGVIILDIYIPGKTGIELCKSLREAEINTPILMMTAQDSFEIVEKGFRAGANDYLPKPFPFELLLAKVEVLDPSRTPSVFPEDI